MPLGPHTALFYDYVADIVERRAPHRDAHLAWIDEWIAAGAMLMAGALGDPPTGALFVFGDVPGHEVERFAEGDPYAAAGLVSAHRVVPWTVVRAA